jgi:hypothetical protein
MSAAWDLGKICMKTKAPAPGGGVIRRLDRSPALVYQALAEAPGGQEQPVLIAEAVPERDRKAVVKVRTPDQAMMRMPSVRCGSQVSGPTRREGGKRHSRRQGNLQYALAEHGSILDRRLLRNRCKRGHLL